jgi:hypothetical protein
VTSLPLDRSIAGTGCCGSDYMDPSTTVPSLTAAAIRVLLRHGVYTARYECLCTVCTTPVLSSVATEEVSIQAES